MMTDVDVLVIGAGVAGASAAAELASGASVLLLDMESAPGYHATGRSAAYFAPAYGNVTVRELTAASHQFYRAPPAGFSEVPLLLPRPAMFIGETSQQASIEAMRAENIALRTEAEPWRLAPILRRELATLALVDETGGDLDVDAILQGFLKRLRARDGRVITSSPVTALTPSPTGWQVTAGSSTFTADIVVNAAGAWADNVAALAGLGTLGIQPMRRTAVLVDPPADTDPSSWPLVIDVDENFYFKPEAGQILVSPADETPSEPTDAQPEDYDVAVALDRFMRVADIDVRKVNHRWAGLRSFAPDRTFIVGFDPRASGFFWLAGQGGYGVQSAPAIAQLTRHLVLDEALPADYKGIAGQVDSVSPARFL